MTLWADFHEMYTRSNNFVNNSYTKFWKDDKYFSLWQSVTGGQTAGETDGRVKHKQLPYFVQNTENGVQKAGWGRSWAELFCISVETFNSQIYSEVLPNVPILQLLLIERMH
jgi:hypothetical protein